jgi:hypothetical protein
MGRPSSHVRVVDDDRRMSGAVSHQRIGYQRLEVRSTRFRLNGIFLPGSADGTSIGIFDITKKYIDVLLAAIDNDAEKLGDWHFLSVGERDGRGLIASTLGRLAPVGGSIHPCTSNARETLKRRRSGAPPPHARRRAIKVGQHSLSQLSGVPPACNLAHCQPSIQTGSA